MDAEIVRITKNDLEPQIGVFLYQGLPQFLTLEETVTGPEKCIPPGTYTCRKTFNRKIGNPPKLINIPVTFEVMNVPGRYGILFHAGNNALATRGCICPGTTLENPRFVGRSVEAFNEFLKLFEKTTEFNLTVRKA